MDTQEAPPGLMILEEDIAEEDGNIVIDWYLDLSFYITTKKSFKISMWHFSDNVIGPHQISADPKISKINKFLWG